MVTYLDDMVKAIRAMASRPFLVDASCLTPRQSSMKTKDTRALEYFLARAPTQRGADSRYVNGRAERSFDPE